MKRKGLRSFANQKLYAFAKNISRGISDSRRRRFLYSMIAGLVIGGHVHLTKIARAVATGNTNIHAAEKILSRHLDSEHWSMQSVMDQLLAWSASSVTSQSLIVADLTDIAKDYAKSLEGLGMVRDASDLHSRLVPGYMLFEAYVRVGKWQLFPLVMEPMQAYAGGPTSENAEILQHIWRIEEATQHQATWVYDRGGDRSELLLPMLSQRVSFVIRQRGDRHVITEDGRKISQTELACEWLTKHAPQKWTPRGVVAAIPMHLPDTPDHELLLVCHWRRPDSEPLLLLVSPAARRAGRTSEWFVKAYRQRWGVEDATRGIKQQFQLEDFMVRSWRSIRRLMALVAVAFYWLNLWGDDEYSDWRAAIFGHPWRIPKAVKYLFDWIAEQMRKILHPRPMIELIE